MRFGDEKITVKEVLNTMTEEQRTVLYVLVGTRISEIQDGSNIVHMNVRSMLREPKDLAVYDSMTDVQKAVVDYFINEVDKED